MVKNEKTLVLNGQKSKNQLNIALETSKMAENGEEMSKNEVFKTITGYIEENI